MAKYLYSPIAFNLQNGAQMLAPITPDGMWCCRTTGPIYASSTAKLAELVAHKAAGLVTVEAGMASVFGGFAGWATARPAAKAAPAPKPAATPWLDAARKAGGAQAKAKAASDAPRTPAQTAHWLRLCMDYAAATLAGEMGGDLQKRAKAAHTALQSYVESCSHYGVEADPAYEPAVNELVAAIAKRLATG